MLLPGGTESQSLEPSTESREGGGGESMRGGLTPPPLSLEGSGGPPPEKFYNLCI